uniref:TLC domain-containing protein n=1 Tax=Panagrellus redivivus TaxID=6233 RepID=A0A7E4WBF3_PANRE
MLNFWEESFWLPQSATWDDFKSNGTIRYPQASELQYTVLVGAILLITRILVESFVFLPIGVAFGWIDTTNEGFCSRVFGHLFGGFAGRRKFKRVAESAWRFTYYFFSFFIGLYIISKEPQFKDVDDCWRDYPHQNVNDAVWWYYVVETGFYWSLFFSTFVFDVRRSDFWQMVIHHVITISLLSISFTVNCVRVGTLILLSHDAADVLIELGKLFRYAHWNTALNILYVIFMLVWIGTRLIYYPFWVIHSVIYTAPPLIQANYRWEDVFQAPMIPRVLAVMLISLVGLHVFWTYLLIKIAIKSRNSGSLDDIREESDSEATSPESSPKPVRKEKKKQK